MHEKTCIKNDTSVSSVLNFDHYTQPLASADPEGRGTGVKTKLSDPSWAEAGPTLV